MPIDSCQRDIRQARRGTYLVSSTLDKSNRVMTNESLTKIPFPFPSQGRESSFISYY